MTEIGAHRGADTIGAATEVHGVEVALEYLLLREVLLELDREHVGRADERGLGLDALGWQFDLGQRVADGRDDRYEHEADEEERPAPPPHAVARRPVGLEIRRMDGAATATLRLLGATGHGRSACGA